MIHRRAIPAGISQLLCKPCEYERRFDQPAANRFRPGTSLLPSFSSRETFPAKFIILCDGQMDFCWSGVGISTRAQFTPDTCNFRSPDAYPRKEKYFKAFAPITDSCRRPVHSARVRLWPIRAAMPKCF
jgi:hypothetical protein